MTLQAITPEQAKALLDAGAVLVDVREADEHARSRVPGARHVPLSRIDDVRLDAGGRPVIFHCRRGARTGANAPRLAAKAGDACETYVVAGGLEAWKRAGLPVAEDRSQPLEIQRQVQIGAGSLALVGTVLGVTVSPWFLAVPAFVGAGLTFAGLTGFCGMARLLVYMPWNKAMRASA
jgi:rhodanese-related sulfurtransferase